MGRIIIRAELQVELRKAHFGRAVQEGISCIDIFVTSFVRALDIFLFQEGTVARWQGQEP